MNATRDRRRQHKKRLLSFQSKRVLCLQAEAEEGPRNAVEQGFRGVFEFEPEGMHPPVARSRRKAGSSGVMGRAMN